MTLRIVDQAAMGVRMGVKTSAGSTGMWVQESVALGLSPMVRQWDLVWKAEVVGRLGGSIAGLVQSSPEMICRVPLTEARYHRDVAAVGLVLSRTSWVYWSNTDAASAGVWVVTRE